LENKKLFKICYSRIIMGLKDIVIPGKEVMNWGAIEKLNTMYGRDIHKLSNRWFSFNALNKADIKSAIATKYDINASKVTDVTLYDPRRNISGYEISNFDGDAKTTPRLDKILNNIPSIALKTRKPVSIVISGKNIDDFYNNIADRFNPFRDVKSGLYGMALTSFPIATQKEATSYEDEITTFDAIDKKKIKVGDLYTRVTPIKVDKELLDDLGHDNTDEAQTKMWLYRAKINDINSGIIVLGVEDIDRDSLDIADLADDDKAFYIKHLDISAKIPTRGKNRAATRLATP
jgi:hypothetical protein